MKRFWVAVALVAMMAWPVSAQTNDFTKQLNIKLRLVLEDNNYLYYGTSGNFRQRWNTSTSRLELTDAAGNLMGAWQDAGTTGALGINTSSPGGTLDVLSGTAYGQVLLTTTKTDSQIQRAGIAGQHYTAAEEPIMIFRLFADATTSQLDIGGGSSSFNAPTQIRLMTGANTTTTTGTAALTINSSQNATFAGDAAVNGGDITSTASTMNVFNTTSTTVNAFGKATALTVGEDGFGKTDVRNMLVTSQVNTFTANDTTPSVAGANLFVVPGTWTGGNNITALDDGVEGQVVTIIGGDSDCVVTDGSTLKLAGNWTAAADDTLRVVKIGSNWYEVGRSDN